MEYVTSHETEGYGILPEANGNASAYTRAENAAAKALRVGTAAPMKVTGLTATQKDGAEGGLAVLAWDAATDAAGVKYVVEYSVKSDFAKDTVSTVEVEDPCAVLPVAPGQYIYYRVRAVDNSGRMSAWVTGKYGEPTTAPANAKIGSIDGRKASLLWDIAEGATSYVVTLVNKQTGKSVVKTVKTTSVVLTVADGEYTWTVQSVSAAGIKSAAIPAGDLLVDLTAPKAVTKLTPVQSGDGLALKWTAPKDATGLHYTVEYSENADFSESGIMEVEGTTASIPAAAGSQLYFRVKAIDKAGNESPWSQASVLTATTQGRRATLCWAAVEGAASYVVTFTGADGRVTTKKAKANLLTASLADNAYSWTVKALDKKGQTLSTQTGRGFQVDSVAPTKVAGLAATQKEGSVGETAVLTWGASSDVSDVKYIVEYSTKSNFAKGTVTALETTELSAELPVTPGRYVYYRITAVDSAGNKSKAATGKYGEPAAAPSWQRIAFVHDRKVTFTWEAVDGATSYIVRLTNTLTGKVTTKTVKLANVKMTVGDGDYTWTVQAVTAAGIKSAESAAGNLLLDLTAPKAVTKLTSVQVDGGLELTWTAPKDGTSLRYVVEWSENADFTDSQTMEVDTTSAILSATAGTQLYCRVKAVDKVDHESPWANVGVLTSTTKGRRVTLDWAAVEGAAYYIVTLTDEKGKVTTKNVKTNALATVLSDNVYSWTVNAVTKKGEVLPEQTGKGFQVDSIAPANVVLLSARQKDDDDTFTLVLTWAESADASDVKYLVEFSTSGDFVNDTVKSMEVTETTAEYTTSRWGLVYYRVRAVDSFGNMSRWTTDYRYLYHFIHWPIEPIYVLYGKDTLASMDVQELSLQDEDTAGIESWVGESKGSDLYKLTLDEDARLHLGLDAADQPVKVQIAAQDASAPITSECGSGLDKELALSAGTYYVEVSAVGVGSDYNTGYTLDLELETEGTRRQAMLASVPH